MRVLIADDDCLVRYTLSRLLRETGCEVIECRDGGEVLERLEDALPTILVLDLLMPRATGYDVLRWLQQSDPERVVKVVILSAFVVDADGFDQHPHVVAVLQKPLVLEQFNAALAHCEVICQTA